MEVYKQLDSIPFTNGNVVTIGTFDGCHRGHQDIIKKVTSHANSIDGKSVIITFDPHPRHVLQTKDKLPILMHIDKKLEIFKSLGLDIALIIPFDKNFSKLDASTFLKTIIIDNFDPDSIIVGYDHHFGFNRDGSPDFLKKFGLNNGFKVQIVEPVSDENVIISSTHIRELIRNGFVRRASFELGWVFGFKAKVVHGSGRGVELGFPTANFIPEEENQLVPANGVYFIRGRINGENLYGMCNLGVRPTFNETDFVMEV
ncbi:MAG: riboflavin kinase, partial [Candidatus Neomarinimicrobiota bacterium]|nr:riboflavin kinase [Candidatus Neomarinimicrobiota bacterium]